jgi:hypothetical protein
LGQNPVVAAVKAHLIAMAAAARLIAVGAAAHSVVAAVQWGRNFQLTRAIVAAASKPALGRR